MLNGFDALQRAAALAGVTAAVVGVIGNLSVCFALHVLFRTVETARIGPVGVAMPDLNTFDWRSRIIALAAAILLLKWRRSVPLTLTVCAVCGLGLSAIG